MAPSHSHLSFHFHPIHAHAQCFLECFSLHHSLPLAVPLFSSSPSTYCCFLFLFPFLMTDGDSVTINNLRDSFVTLDDYLSPHIFRAPHSRDVRIWVSTMFTLISLKTEKLRDLSEDQKLQGPHAEGRNGESRNLVLQNFGDLMTAKSQGFSV